MEAIKDTINSVIRGMLEKKAEIESGPEAFLKKILTKKDLAHIKVKYLRKGVLGLSVDSSSWLYKFSLQKQELLAGLNQAGQKIKDIHLHIGDIK